MLPPGGTGAPKAKTSRAEAVRADRYRYEGLTPSPRDSNLGVRIVGVVRGFLQQGSIWRPDAPIVRHARDEHAVGGVDVAAPLAHLGGSDPLLGAVLGVHC